MRIFGGGSLEDIKLCCELGSEGILTNPQGFEQYFQGERSLDEITRAIVDITDVPVFIQIQAGTTEELVQKARMLNKISSRIGFKIMSNENGFRAMKMLQSEGIKCIATCLFSLSQAALAASAGAYGICPFVSRAHDTGIDPYKLIYQIRNGYDRLPQPPLIMGVSLKTVSDVELALAAGVDIVAMRYPLLKQMTQHVLTEKAEILFAKHWATVKGEDISYLHGFLGKDGIAE